jgi:hypothetical protein
MTPHSRSTAGCALAACLLGGVACSARAIGVAIPAAADNTLYEDPTGALSNGMGTAMFAGTTSQISNAIRRGLVRFDIAAAVPAGSTITSATLRLHHASSNLADRTITLHHVLAPWGEGASNAISGNGGGGAPSQAGDATWLHRTFHTDFWVVAGGDFDPSPVASTVVGGIGSYAWSGPGFVDEVQAILDGSISNFGWLLLGVEGTAGTTKRFATREEPNAALRPSLVIEYIPAPSSAMVLVLAARLTRRRRSCG